MNFVRKLSKKVHQSLIARFHPKAEGNSRGKVERVWWGKQRREKRTPGQTGASSWLEGNDCDVVQSLKARRLVRCSSEWRDKGDEEH